MHVRGVEPIAVVSGACFSILAMCWGSTPISEVSNRYIADDLVRSIFAQKLGLIRSIMVVQVPLLVWVPFHPAVVVRDLASDPGSVEMTLAAVSIRLFHLAGFGVSPGVALLLLQKVSPALESILSAFQFRNRNHLCNHPAQSNVVQSLYWWGPMRAYIPPLMLPLSTW